MNNIKPCPFCAHIPKSYSSSRDIDTGKKYEILKHAMIDGCPLSGQTFRKDSYNKRPLEENLKERIMEKQ